MTLDGCEAAMAVASDPARYGAVATLTDGSFRFSQPGDSFDGLVAFKEFHEASGNTVSFHHVFDFTVTRVSKNEAAWKEMEQKLARTWTLLSDAKMGKAAQPAPAPAFPFKLF
jgi:hypothetical protein